MRRRCRAALSCSGLRGTGTDDEGATNTYGDDDFFAPQQRAAYLAEIREQARRREWERNAAPPRTGNLARDLATADEAVTFAERAWEDADTECRRLRANAGPFPDTDTYRDVAAAERRREDLWRIREKAVRHRDAVEADERRWCEPGLGMSPGGPGW